MFNLVEFEIGIPFGLRDEVEDARDAEREWRLKYEGSLSSRTEAERARRDAAAASRRGTAWC